MAMILLAFHLLGAGVLFPSAAVSPSDPLRLNPNVASHAELMLLPGVGPVLAENIVSYRDGAESLPAFRSADDLDAVHRIGPKTVEKLRPYLRFSDDAATLGGERP